MIAMIPKRIMMELLFTGRPMSAQRAYDVCLINAIVEPGALLPEALALAEVIAANAPLSVAAAKHLVEMAAQQGAAAAGEAAPDLYRRVYNSADAQEGPGHSLLADRRSGPDGDVVGARGALRGHGRPRGVGSLVPPWTPGTQPAGMGWVMAP